MKSNIQWVKGDRGEPALVVSLDTSEVAKACRVEVRGAGKTIVLKNRYGAFDGARKQ